MLVQDQRTASASSTLSAVAAAPPTARGGDRPAPGTVTQLFFEAARRYDRADAMLEKRDGRWAPIAHRTVVDRVRRISLALAELGLVPGDRVALLCENRPEWAIADYACLTGRLASVPIYPTLPAEQVLHILTDSGAAGVFVSTAVQAAKVVAVRTQCPALRVVIGIDAGVADGCNLTLAELEARGAMLDTPERAAEWEREALSVRPDDLATLIYTSGTTGAPKGVMLTHDNFHANVMASRRAVPFGGDDVALSFLPLSHIFERMGDYMYWSTGTAIAYVPSLDDVPAALQEVRPTMAMSVPRLYEKMYARVLENAKAGGAVKWRMFEWAAKVADRWADEKLAGRTPAGPLAWQYALAQKLVFSKLQERTGGRMRYFVSGGGPLSPDINKFFYAAGLTILEGYGLTETSPVIAVNTPQAFHIGTVGRVVDGVEVKIAPYAEAQAGDGLILTRGASVMRGYYNNPQATREALDDDGWFNTGDIGRLEDGFLRITDRAKDIIVTAGGKNIAPQPIENAVKSTPFVAQAVVIGDRRKFPLILVVPNWETLEAWAAANGVTWKARADLLVHPDARRKMEEEVRGKFAGLARFEPPKKIVLLEHDFSIERGELTPTLKVK
ncbi:MAG: long-chain fatty acid--CoA ligase, partial [Candidatus Eremiobacteraeota bacterium]|nr:long-chain fatty acid--CoA ligase [Candidatus Eremiobacteraeota bacterium]